MFPELLIVSGLGAAATVIGRKVEQRRQQQRWRRHAAARAQMQALETSQRLAALAWHARQEMHETVIKELRSRSS